MVPSILSLLLFLGLLPLVFSRVPDHKDLEEYLLRYPSESPNSGQLKKGFPDYKPSPDTEIGKPLKEYSELYTGFSSLSGVSFLSQVKQDMIFDSIFVADIPKNSVHHIVLFDNYAPQENIFVLLSTHGCWVMKLSAQFEADVMAEFEEVFDKDPEWTGKKKTPKRMYSSKVFEERVLSRLTGSGRGSPEQFVDKVFSQKGSITHLLSNKAREHTRYAGVANWVFYSALRDWIRSFLAERAPQQGIEVSELTWKFLGEPRPGHETQHFMMAFFYSKTRSRWGVFSIYGGQLGAFTWVAPMGLDDSMDTMELDECEAQLLVSAKIDLLFIQAKPIQLRVTRHPTFEIIPRGQNSILKFQDNLSQRQSWRENEIESAGLAIILFTSPGVWAVVYPSNILTRKETSKGFRRTEDILAAVKSSLEHALDGELSGVGKVHAIVLAPASTGGQAAWGAYLRMLMELVRDVVKQRRNVDLTTAWVIVSSPPQSSDERRLVIQTKHVVAKSSRDNPVAESWRDGPVEKLRIYYGGELQFKLQLNKSGLFIEKRPRRKFAIEEFGRYQLY